MRSLKKVFLWLMICVMLTGCGTRQAQGTEELYVLAASSLSDVLVELGELYKKEHPEVVLRFSFDASGTLARQIEAGASADVFISADTKQMEGLKAKGLMVEETIQDLLANSLVLIKPKQSDVVLESFEDVLKEDIKLIAIGEDYVPVGNYTQKLYETLGLWEEVYAKANLATNVRQVLDWVATENVDCGFVYGTDAATSEEVEVVLQASETLTGPIVYPVGIVQASKAQEEAARWLDFLKTPEAWEVFEAYGFSRVTHTED
ncbi:MAG: molybdate ABC transporter substrate-binding protein [Cellulosilyticaceae bacterium]